MEKLLKKDLLGIKDLSVEEIDLIFEFCLIESKEFWSRKKLFPDFDSNLKSGSKPSVKDNP